MAGERLSMDFICYFYACGIGFAAVFGARLGWECYDELVSRLNRWARALDPEHGGQPKAMKVNSTPPPADQD